MHAIGDASRDVVHEPCGALTIATAAEMRNDELRISFNRGPCPRVAGTVDRAFHRRNVLGLRSREAPDFVDLNALRFDVADIGVMEACAEAAGILQELRHRVDRHVREARHAAHRSAFAERGEDLAISSLFICTLCVSQGEASTLILHFM